MNRKIYYWKLPTTELQLGERTLVMGVLNITPDSFSDGGHFVDPDRAYARALEMEEQGVDIIDIGAESTRPESKRITADEEWQRLVPLLKRLRDKLTVPVSLDTYKSEIAERALDYGVQIINDPSGLTYDAGLAKVAANGNAGLILNHMRGTPETWNSLPPLPDVAGTVVRDLDATTSRARRAGVEKNRIVVDPGLGFGKRKEQNSEIIAFLGRLAELDCPILVGPSRKLFLTHVGDGGETIFATAAAVTAAILNGAHMVRVHDVKEMRAVVLMADEISRLSVVPVKDDEEEDDRNAVRPRPRVVKPLPAYLGEEKHVPMRPPIQRVVAKPVVVTPVVVTPVVVTPVVVTPVEAPKPEVTEAAEQTAIPEIAAAAPDTGAEAPFTEAPAAESPNPEAPKVATPPPAGKPVFVKRPPQTEPSRGWGPAPIRRDPAAGGDRPSYGGDRPSYGGDRRDSRPPFGGGDRGPRPPFGGDRGPRKDFGDRPPRRDFDGPPPRRDFGDRPPRQDFGDRGPRPPFAGGDRGPRKDFGDRPARPPFAGGGDRGPRPPFGGDRGPRKDFGDRPPRRDDDRQSGPRPPFAGGDRGPRKDFGDRPARPPFGGGDRGSRPPFAGGDRGPRPPFAGGDRGPRKDFGDRPRPPFGDRPPRRDDDRPSGPRPPFGGDRAPGGDRGGDRPFRSGPPFGGPPRGGSGGGRPPQRPFRKRP